MMEKIETVICQVVAIACGIGMIVAMNGRRLKIDEAFIWLGSYLVAMGVVKAVFIVCAMFGSKRKIAK